MQLEIGVGNRRVSKDSIAIDILRTDKCDVIASVYALPFRQQSFDQALMFEVLEHLYNPYAALVEIRKVSRSLICSVPNIMHYRIILRWIVKGKATADEEHINAWRLPELTNLFKQAGYRRLHTRYIDTHFHKQRARGLTRLLPRITKHSICIEAEV